MRIMKKLLLGLALLLAGCANDTALEPPVVPVLEPPTKVIADGRNEEVSLTWVAPPGITDFRVYAGANRASLERADVEVRHIYDQHWGAYVPNLENGVRYYFAVTSLLDGEESGRSAVDDAMPVLHDCQERMIETRSERGAPEEVNTYSSGGYRNVDWWYWTQGYNISFSWGSDVLGCDVSIYTFTPIY